MSVTTKTPLGWGNGLRHALPGGGMVDSIRQRVLHVILASEASGPDQPLGEHQVAAKRELAMWLSPIGGERVMGLASWLAAWAFQRPLYLQGVGLGYPFQGSDVLGFMRDVEADASGPCTLEFGYAPTGLGQQIVARYTWPELEPVVWSRCPRVPAEGWTVPTPQPPMPDAWRQEAPDFAFTIPPNPSDQQVLGAFGPGRLDVGLERVKAPTSASATRTSSPSAGKTSSSRLTAQAGPAAPAAAASPPPAATTTGGTARPAEPGSVPERPTQPRSDAGGAGAASGAPGQPTRASTGSARAAQETDACPTRPPGSATSAGGATSHAASGPVGTVDPEDPTTWPSYRAGLSDADGESTIDTLEGPDMTDETDGPLEVHRAPPAPGGLYVPMAIVRCVLCQFDERVRLADVVQRFKGGCEGCQKDVGALAVLEEESGSVKPLVDYLRAAGVPLPASQQPPGAPTAPKRRPSRKPATQEH